ncbi:GTPase IMAP family member 3-like [Conger conger]|uniref:GTPase IMAP family member 3-like n=1 Tax=Conger conger TaxID=82655 RepID=UPI002A5B1109|nr:GTPase IMAP family member 3-like [Conger conger]
MREDDPIVSEGRGYALKEANGGQEEELHKPKQKKERHGAREWSERKNLKLCSNSESLNDLLPEFMDRSFQNRVKEMRGRGELNVPKPCQRLDSHKPAAVIAEGSPAQPPSTVSPTFPLSPQSPSQIRTAFPPFPECPGPSELRLVLLGESWASNSSAGNSILGGQEAQTERGTVRRGQAAGRRVALVEVTGPKWYLGDGAAGHALQRAALCPPGPHAFLLVVPAYLSFTAGYGRAVRLNMAAFGTRVWRHTLVLFTWAEALGESVERHILRSQGLRRLVHRCGNRYHALHSRRNARHVSQLLEKVEEMVASNQG